ncbi:MAG: hypothetical protein NC311_01315 [Muribaculaceae bacterium]|nr:hypothetical protein [Muribaculaceae bacterium]
MWGNVWGALGAIGTICAVMRSLNMLPLKSHSLTGQYWFENKNGFRICIQLQNNSRCFDNVFIPGRGALVSTKTDSRYLTLNADRQGYIIAHRTSRLLKIKTPKHADAYKFLHNNPNHTLWIFTIDNQRIKLTYKYGEKKNETERNLINIMLSWLGRLRRPGGMQ